MSIDSETNKSELNNEEELKENTDKVVGIVLPPNKYIIKESLKLHIFYIVMAVIMGLMGAIIHIYFSLAGGLIYMLSVGTIEVEGYAIFVRMVTNILFSPWGILFMPIRYSYIKGMKDILQGKKVKYFYYYKHILEIIGVLKIEVFLIILAYIITGINVRWGTQVFTMVTIILLYITRVAIMIKTEDKNKGTEELIDESICIVQRGYPLILVTLVVNVIISGVIGYKGSRIILINMTGMSYIINMALAYVYVKYKQDRG